MLDVESHRCFTKMKVQTFYTKYKVKDQSLIWCLGGNFLEFSINWDSLHARLRHDDEAWSYKLRTNIPTYPFL